MLATDLRLGMRLYTPCWGWCIIRTIEPMGRRLRIVVYDPVVDAWTHTLIMAPSRVVTVARELFMANFSHHTESRQSGGIPVSSSWEKRPASLL